MVSRRLFILGLVVGTVAMLTVAGPVLAAEPDDATLEIIMQVSADGSWSIPSFGGVDLGLTNTNVDALTKRLNMNVAIPTIDAQTIKTFSDQNIQALALIKEGQKITVLVNNQPLSAITLGDEAIAAVNSFVPELEDMVGSLAEANVTIGLQFLPTAGEVPALDVTPRVATAAAEEAINTIGLGTTISPEGRVLSLAGLPVEALGLAPMQFDTSLLTQLGVTQLQANVANTGVSVLGNGAEYLRLDWDMGLLKEQVYTSYPVLTGTAITDDTRRMVDVAMDWIADSNIQVNAQIADEIHEPLPVLQLARPIMVEIKNDNTLAVEGLPLAINVGDQVGAYRSQIQNAALRWDGANTRLNIVVNDTQLPCLSLQPELVSTVGKTFLDPGFMWDEISGLLGSLGLSAGISFEGSPAPDVTRLDYEVATGAEVPVAIPNVSISRADGSIAINNSTLPLNTIKNLFGVDIVGTILPQIQALSGVETASVVVAPGGLTVGVNGGEATLAWDKQLRDNLVTFAMGTFMQGRVIDLTTTKESGLGAMFPSLKNLPDTLEVGMVRTLFDAICNYELGATITLQDEALPAAYLDTLAAKLPVAIQ